MIKLTTEWPSITTTTTRAAVAAQQIPTRRLIDRLDSCFNRRKLADTLLLLINAFIALKSSANLVAYLKGSKGLILDYDGALLLNESFKLTFLLLNASLLAISTSYLMLVLFCSTTTKTTKNRRKLNKYIAISQLLLAALLVILLAKLWFVPLHLRLNETRWRATIRDYTYTFASPASYTGATHSYHEKRALQGDVQLVDITLAANLNYELEVDRLQHVLGCCGIWDPSEWVRQNEHLGLLAPSCCTQPAILDTERTEYSLYLNQSQVEDSTGEIQVQRLFCKALDSDHISGCQRLLNDREVRFTFNLRLSLLALLATLILMAFATLSFNKVSSSSSSSLTNIQVVRSSTQPVIHLQHPHSIPNGFFQWQQQHQPSLLARQAFEPARDEARLVEVVRGDSGRLDSPVLTFQ